MTDPTRPYIRISLRDRFLAWLVTGPVGRLVAFVLDLGTVLIKAARRRGRDA
jgi:hypothetical protein